MKKKYFYGVCIFIDIELIFDKLSKICKKVRISALAKPVETRRSFEDFGVKINQRDKIQECYFATEYIGK